MIWALAVVPVLLVALWWSLTQPLVFAASPRASVAEVDPARLEAHVRKLAEELYPRDFLHEENLDAAAAWITSEFEAAGARVSEQVFDVDEGTYRNVIGVFGPEDGSRVVVGAHVDTAGEQPGADDNASGVAGLVELAHALGKTKDRLKKRVELVAWTLEEPPHFRTKHMGSWVHADSLKKAGVELEAVISLEMLGYFSDEPGSQQFPSACLKPFYPSRGNFIAVIGLIGQGRLTRKIKGAMKGASDLPVKSMNGIRAIPGVDFSDQFNYWDRGYRGVMITDTAFYRNPNYHETTDRPETLDYTRFAKVVQGVHQAVLALAE